MVNKILRTVTDRKKKQVDYSNPYALKHETILTHNYVLTTITCATTGWQVSVLITIQTRLKPIRTFNYHRVQLQGYIHRLTIVGTYFTNQNKNSMLIHCKTAGNSHTHKHGSYKKCMLIIIISFPRWN